MNTQTQNQRRLNFFFTKNLIFFLSWFRNKQLHAQTHKHEIKRPLLFYETFLPFFFKKIIFTSKKTFYSFRTEHTNTKSKCQDPIPGFMIST